MSGLLQKFLVVGSVFGAAVLSFSPSQAASLGFYSVDIDTDELVSIDVSTGAVRVIGGLGIDLNSIDLVILNGKLYGVNNNFSPQEATLLQIDTNTGIASSLGTLLRGTDQVALVESVAARDGKLFVGFTTTPRSPFSNRLGELQLDGTIVNDEYLGLRADLDGLGASPSGVLFSTDGVPSIRTTFISTLEPLQSIGSYSSDDGGLINDLDFLGNELFGISHDQDLLHRVDSLNGTLIDTVALNRDGTYHGLATIPDNPVSTPEPSTLLGLGTLALAGGTLLRCRHR